MRLRSIVPAALAAALAVPAAAQAGCEGAEIPDLGFDRFSIRNGSIHTRVEDGRATHSFSGQPTILGVRPDGPAAGRLEEGDVLVAVDGRAIDSPAGSERYGALRRGERVTLTIRRGGRAEDVEIVSGRRCLRAPAAPTPPRAPRPPTAARAPRAPAPPPSPAHPAPPAPPATPAHPAPPAPPPAPAPPPPPEIMPDGWFGFGIRCTDCGMHDRSGFHFNAPPSVMSVEPGTPAARAGMRRGDVLTGVDGVSLTTPEGWRRFAAIQPRQQVRWTYVRDGRTHNAVMTARPRPDAGRAPAPAASPEAGRLRYSGRVGDVRVEARGGPVTVSRDPATGETVIRSADLTVRIRPDEG